MEWKGNEQRILDNGASSLQNAVVTCDVEVTSRRDAGGRAAAVVRMSFIQRTQRGRSDSD